MVQKSLLMLINDARDALNLHTNVDLAKFLGVSRRSVQRHNRTGGLPSGIEVEKLVRALYPLNQQLAKTIGSAYRVDLTDLEPRPRPAAAAPPAPTAPAVPAAGREHVAMVIVVACDALNLPPREVRPALAAIFTQVRSLGVDLDQLTRLLAGEPRSKAQKA